MIQNTVSKYVLFFILFAKLGIIIGSENEKEELTPITIQTLYGEFIIKEPILIELIHSKTFQRLKHINQYGVTPYIRKEHSYEFKRDTHSLGVALLLKRYGAELDEIIAGLLHDVSHTVFSHVGDFIFDQEHQKDAYQDDIHGDFIRNSDIAPILKKYGYSVEQILHKKGTFHMLEQELPDICADRLEYILHGGYLINCLSQEDIYEVLDNICYENKKWYFTDPKIARKICDASLIQTTHIFGSPWNFLTYRWAANALKRAVKTGLLSLDDIHYSIDDVIWKKLLESNDPIIQYYLDAVMNHRTLFALTTQNEEYDLNITAKFRGLNPWIKTDNGFARLTEIDPEYAEKFNHDKKLHEDGWYVRFTPEYYMKRTAIKGID